MRLIPRPRFAEAGLMPDASVSITAVPERAIAIDVERQLGELLDSAFPGMFAGRAYFKQLPHLRLVATDGRAVVGQVGVDHRIVRVGDRVCPIFGLIDVCVAASHRRRGIGSRLLGEAERMAGAAGLAHLFLMADEDLLYPRNG